MELVYKNIKVTITPKNRYVDEVLENEGAYSAYMKSKDLCDIYFNIIGETVAHDVAEFDELQIENAEDLMENLVGEFIHDYDEDVMGIPLENYIKSELKKREEDQIKVENADILIIFLNQIFKHDRGHTRKIEIHYEGHPFWICHDICHAEKDVSGIIVNVDSHIEERRINEGFKLLASYGLRNLYTLELHKSIKDMFEERFGREIETPEIDEFLDYYE